MLIFLSFFLNFLTVSFSFLQTLDNLFPTFHSSFKVPLKFHCTDAEIEVSFDSLKQSIFINLSNNNVKRKKLFKFYQTLTSLSGRSHTDNGRDADSDVSAVDRI